MLSTIARTAARAGFACIWAAALVSGPLAQETAKIGLLTDLSGTTSAINGKGSEAAVLMAIEDFGGTVLGKPIGFVDADHQHNANIGVATAREWFDAQGVTAILGVNDSAVSLGINELARSKGKIFMSDASLDDLIGKFCSPDTSTEWAPSTTGLARAVATPAAKAGHDDWYFLTVNYAFGLSLEKAATKAVQEAGRTVVGTSHHPGGETDFSSYLLDAQARGAKTLALATYGAMMSTIVKQAREFGMKVTLVPFYLAETDVDAIGLEHLGGVESATPFYWGRTAETRAFAKRYRERFGRPPTFGSEEDYNETIHYLKAVQAAGTVNAKAVSAKMREIPVEDATGVHATIRADGRVMKDMYAFKVKIPAESKGEWDYFTVTETEKATDIYPPLSQSECPLLPPGSK